MSMRKCLCRTSTNHLLALASIFCHTGRKTVFSMSFRKIKLAHQTSDSELYKLPLPNYGKELIFPYKISLFKLKSTLFERSIWSKPSTVITDVVKVVEGALEAVSREITAQLVLCVPSGAVGGVRLLVAGPWLASGLPAVSLSTWWPSGPTGCAFKGLPHLWSPTASRLNSLVTSIETKAQDLFTVHRSAQELWLWAWCRGGAQVLWWEEKGCFFAPLPDRTLPAQNWELRNCEERDKEKQSSPLPSHSLPQPCSLDALLPVCRLPLWSIAFSCASSGAPPGSTLWLLTTFFNESSLVSLATDRAMQIN